MNKQLPLFLFFSILFSVQTFGRELYVEISIKNPTSDVLSFSYTQNALLGEAKTYKIPVKSDGDVYTIIKVERHPILRISYGTTQFEAYIENLDKLLFSFDANDILSTLIFRGEGSDENNLLNASENQLIKLDKTLSKTFISTKVNSELLQLATSGISLSDYKKKISEKPLIQNDSLNSKVIQYINQRNKYSYLTNLTTFFIANRKNWTATDYQKLAVENHFLEGFVLWDDESLNDDFYTNFVQAYIYFQDKKGFSTNSSSQFVTYEIAANLLKEETRDWMLCKILINAKKEKYETLAQKKFFQLKRTSPFRRYTKAVEQIYGDALTFDPDGAAPNFTLKNESGKEVSLSDFEGKVVYISFWASWCRPCLANFTKSEGIRLQMMDKGVALINICLDSSESTWQRTMTRVPMPGVNLYASADTPLKLKYDLSRLPAYYIVNKKGNFTYLPDGPRDILVEFEKLANE